MNVNKIYNLIKNAVCLQCRNDIVQIRKPGNNLLVTVVIYNP